MGARKMMGMRDRPPGSGEVDPLYTAYSRIPIVELWTMPPGSTTVGLAEAAGDVRWPAPSPPGHGHDQRQLGVTLAEALAWLPPAPGAPAARSRRWSPLRPAGCASMRPSGGSAAPHPSNGPFTASAAWGWDYLGEVSVTREQRLVETFVELADTLVEDFDVIDFLHTLVGRCVQLLDVDAAGVMLIDQHGHLHVAAASTENARLLELFELQADAGPCVDCCRTGIAVLNADLDARAGQCPRFAEAARAAGFTAAHALPLRLRGTVIGALILFCADDPVLSVADVGTGQAMADVATMGILAQRTVQQSELLAAQLEHALSSRIAIEQAKGVLAERRHITVDQAFAQLRDHARRNNLRLSDLARQVAEGASIGFEPPLEADQRS